jgi:hypothetical protein
MLLSKLEGSMTGQADCSAMFDVNFLLLVEYELLLAGSTFFLQAVSSIVKISTTTNGNLFMKLFYSTREFLLF